MGWAIDRVDQKNLNDPTSNGYYNYDNTGQGVHVYIVDSGINGSHEEFQVPIIFDPVANFAQDGVGNNGIDPLGHGTAVASYIGGKRLGVAKFATMHSVRIFGSTGGSTTARIVQSLDWIASDISFRRLVAGGRDKYPAIVNLSFETAVAPSSNPTETNAVKALVNLGVTVVVAAGNHAVNIRVVAAFRIKHLT